MDLSNVSEGELKNDFYKSLTPLQWKKYHTKINKVMNSTYGNLSRTDIIDGKIVCTEIKNHKEQVVNILKTNNPRKLNSYIKEELNVYGYSGEQVQKFIEEMYGEENVYRYSTTSSKFERLPKFREDSGQTIESDRQFNGKTIQRSDKRYNNRELKELENSSFSYDTKGTKEWNNYLKENFPSSGTKTKMSDIKLPVREFILNYF